MLASEMHELAKKSVEKDDTVNKYYKKAVEDIKKAASEGRNDICFYSLTGSHDYDNREKFMKKLENNGFVLAKGYAIGKPMCNSESLYVVW